MAGLSSEHPILLTGASGYLATHCLYLLLDRGVYVRGTVRSLSDPAKVAPLKSLHKKATTHLQLVEADLEKDEGWDKAFQGVLGVLHVASPFPKHSPKHAADIINPAVEGTDRVLHHAGKANVKRVVLTSSIYAVTGGHPRSRYASSKAQPFTEKEWSDPHKQSWWYARSKTLAEKRALEINLIYPNMDLIILNPAFIVGPMVVPTVSRSSDIVLKLLTSKLPALPPVQYPCVDVRDCAMCHITALLDYDLSGEEKKRKASTSPKAKPCPSMPPSTATVLSSTSPVGLSTSPTSPPRRFILASETYSLTQMALSLRSTFSPFGFRVRCRTLPTFVAKMGSLFNPELSNIRDEMGLVQCVDASLSEEYLKISYRPVRESLTDHGLSLAKFAIILPLRIPPSLMAQHPYPHLRKAKREDVEEEDEEHE